VNVFLCISVETAARGIIESGILRREGEREKEREKNKHGEVANVRR